LNEVVSIDLNSIWAVRIYRSVHNAGKFE